MNLTPLAYIYKWQCAPRCNRPQTAQPGPLQGTWKAPFFKLSLLSFGCTHGCCEGGSQILRAQLHWKDADNIIYHFGGPKFESFIGPNIFSGAPGSNSCHIFRHSTVFIFSLLSDVKTPNCENNIVSGRVFLVFTFICLVFLNLFSGNHIIVMMTTPCVMMTGSQFLHFVLVSPSYGRCEEHGQSFTSIWDSFSF